MDEVGFGGVVGIFCLLGNMEFGLADSGGVFEDGVEFQATEVQNGHILPVGRGKVPAFVHVRHPAVVPVTLPLHAPDRAILALMYNPADFFLPACPSAREHFHPS